MAHERTSENALSVQLDGGETCTALFSVVRSGRARFPALRLVTAGGDVVRPRRRESGRIEYYVPASGRFVLSW